LILCFAQDKVNKNAYISSTLLMNKCLILPTQSYYALVTHTTRIIAICDLALILHYCVH